MIEQKQNPPKHEHKSEICRFYLRGLCLFKANECNLAHSVWDLNFTPYTEGEVIEYDYSKVAKDKKQIIKGPRNYVNLYNFQKEKIFTLQQLNEDRGKRNLVRNLMCAEMYNDFIGMLKCYYPDQLFTESFLLREFTRVGFHKPHSIMKLNHIQSLLCDCPSSRYYIISTILPPCLKSQTKILITLPPEEQIINFYKQSYEEFLQQQQKPTESEIKKYLFSVYRPSYEIIPLNLVLKRNKMNFSNFLKLISNQTHEIAMDTDQQTLLKGAAGFIQESVTNGKGYCSWQDVFKFISNSYKINNANITNQLKPKLIKLGFVFLNFPMIQLVSTQQAIHNWKWNENQYLSVCQCSCKQLYPTQQLMLDLLQFDIQELPPNESLDIYNLQTLLRCAPFILNSKILAVDIEGRLRKNGFIEMIQLNNGVNTFLIDIYRMLNEGQIETVELTKKIMRNTMCNGEIIKIFHDCRHDTLVLHEIMKTCVINIFDTSCVETYIGQLQIYKSEQDCNKILKTISNVKTPGLNEILKKYEAPHGINKNKDWFHQLWRKGHTDLFELRPLDPQYRQYCIKDVLDLPHVHTMMSKSICPSFTNWISSHYVRAGYLYSIEGG